MFAEYVAHGWHLTPIEPGKKGPIEKGWNTQERMITHPLAASKLKAAGLCHAYSGTCAIDIDDYVQAKAWLHDRGIDLDALMHAPGTVQIVSPAKGRGKLIYQCLVPMPSKKILNGDKTILEFRCASSNGLTVQDVLPPSPHPDGEGGIDGPYEWHGDWRNLSDLPASLFTLWSSLVAETAPAEAEPTHNREHLIDLLRGLSPDMGYDDWNRVGMAIHHEFGGSEEGFALWNAWSSRGTKYKGPNDLRSHWSSYTPGGGITAHSLVTMQEASPSDFPDETRIAEINKAADKPATPVKLLTARELLKPHDSPPFLVDGILEHGAEASLIGPSKSYKSLWALQLGICIATGTPFFNRTVEQGLVVALIGEGQGGIRHRLQALRYGMGMDFSDAPFVVLPRPFALPTIEGVKTVKQYIAEAEQAYNRKLSLLIIDTYGRYAAGDENVAEDLYKFFLAARACRDQAALLIVHHTGHSDATRGRGTSAWDQAVDTEFVASIKGDTDTRVIENTKQKDGEPCAPMFFRLARYKTDSTRDGEPVYSVALEPTVVEAAAPKLGANEQIVYDTVVAHPGAPQEEIITAAVEQIPKPEGRDKRRERVRTSLLSLISKKAVVLRGDNVFKVDDVAAEFAALMGDADAAQIPG